MQRLFVVCLWILALLSYLETSEVKFIATTLHLNPKLVSNFTMAIGKDTHYLNVDITLIQPIIKDFYAAIDVQVKLRNSPRYQSLFMEEFDVCELVNNVFLENLMKKWYRNLLKYGNFMENCPVPEGQYYLRDLQVEQSSLAMYLRPGDYRIVGQTYFRERGKPKVLMVKGSIEIKWVK